VGRRALVTEQQAGGPARRLVGLDLEWSALERLYLAQDLPPVMSPITSREPVPVFDGHRQIGRATSTTWSPILKRAIALASIRADRSEPGTALDVEWTVEARRARVAAKVAPLPFFDPPRKRG
jgi:aminomethyltransferase